MRIVSSPLYQFVYRLQVAKATMGVLFKVLMTIAYYFVPPSAQRKPRKESRVRFCSVVLESLAFQTEEVPVGPFPQSRLMPPVASGLIFPLNDAKKLLVALPRRFLRKPKQ